MRSTTITSTFAAVVTVVIDRLAVAGTVVRTGLHRTSMREHFSQWQESYSADRSSGNKPGLNPRLSLKRLGGSPAYAACPAYAVISGSALRG
ncbi:MAG: hypothetical protein U0892_13240 [Pirellulales bacterium]